MISINQINNLIERYSVTTPERLINPKILDGLSFKLPYNSSLHMLHTAMVNEYVNKKQPIINNSDSVYIKTITEYTGETVGSFQHKNSEIRNFLRESKSLADDMNIIREDKKINLKMNDLLVYNYGGLQTFNKYVANPLTPQFAVKNQLTTLVSRLNREAKLSRNLFVNIEIAIPELVKLEEVLNKKLTGNMIANFKSYNVMIFIELWKFLNPKTKDESVFSKLSPEACEKTTFIFASNGIIGMANLSYLFSMLEGKEYDEYRSIKVQNISHKQLRKSLYIFLNKIVQESLIVNGGLQDDTSFDEKEIESSKEAKEIKKDLLKNVGVVDGNKKASDLPKDLTSDSKLTDKEIDAEMDIVTEEMVNNEDALEILDIDGEISKADIDDVSTKYKELTKADILNGGNDKSLLAKDRILELKNLGLLTDARYKRLNDALERQKNLKFKIDGLDITYDDIMKAKDVDINSSDTDVAHSPSVPDKAMSKNVIGSFDKKIITEQLTPTILKSILSMQGNNILTNIEVEESETILGGANTFKFTFENLDGGQSTNKLIIPKVKPDGVFKMSGNPYYMRKQKSDVPINKISSSRVALSSSYGKLFIDKAIVKRYDISYWFKRNINKRYLNNDNVSGFLENTTDTKITDLHLPRHYLIASKYVSGFTFGDYKFNFSYKFREGIHPDIEELESDGGVLIGLKGKNPILMMPNNAIVISEKSGLKEVGTLFDILELPLQLAPVMFAVLKIYSKAIPVGLILAFYFGLDNLLKAYGAEYELLPRNERIKNKDDVYVTLFADKKLVIKKDYGEGDLVFGGLQTLNNTLKEVHYVNLQKRDSFAGLFAMLDLSIVHVTQIKTLEEFFVDPHTEDILKLMKEPTVFTGLLVRSIELLLDDNYKHPNHVKGIHVKGHDRIAAMAYRDMIDGLVSQRNRSNFGKAKLTINPYAVIKRINEDSTVVIVDDINPMAASKQTEDVTALGFGGRPKDAMSKDTRPIHPTEIGLFSEANKDSGSVGITAYLTANPRINNTLGVVDEHDVKNDNWANLLSTSGMMAAFVINDDVKRSMFLSIQNSHVVPTANMKTPYVLTGYESVFCVRVMDKYVVSAPDDGVVTNVTPSKVTVDYKPKAIIVKGNPDKEVSKVVTEEFYSAIAKILESKNYRVQFIESDLTLGEIPSASKDDVYVLFSRGDKYLKDLRNRSKSTIIGIGTRYSDELDLSLRNKDDKTNDKDLSKSSLLAHWSMSNAMTKEFKDYLKEGKTKSEKYKLYTWFTKEEDGASFPRTIVSNVRKGDIVTKDDTLTYEKSFFAPNIYDKKRVVYRQGNMALTAFIEDMESFEDSVSLSHDYAKSMATDVVKTSSQIISTDQTIVSVKSIGSKVSPSEQLYRITDKDFKGEGLDDKTLEIIQDIKADSPKSDLEGSIVDIVIYYNCELEDLEDDLRYHVEQSDLRLKATEGFTGKVNSSYSIKGRPLLEGELEIKVKIRYVDTVGVGDKVILANQLKCTNGHIYKKITTHDNRILDAVFSISGPSNRIVLSTYRIALLSTHMQKVEQISVDMYFD